MNQEIEQQLHLAESDIAASELRYGPNHPELAEKLSKYAALLRQTEKRALDAVNVEARAKAIRAKLYAAEAAAQDARVKVIKPPKQTTNPLTYIGIGAMCVAFSTLFIDQTFFGLFAICAVFLVLVDLALSRNSAIFRGCIAIGVLACTWWSIQSLPAVMLVDTTPMERLNYASEHPDMVATVRKMGAPKPVMAYRLCLPSGLEQVSDDNAGKREWGRLLTWKSAPQAETKTRIFQMAAMTVPDKNRKFPNFALGKLTRQVVMPRMAEQLGWDEVKQNSPVFEEINGFDFVKVEFSGRDHENGQEMFGFVYVMKDRRGLLVISGTDNGPGFDSLEPMEASAYTIGKQSGKELDI